MKGSFKIQVLLLQALAVSFFLIASSVKVGASGKPEILSTHLGFLDQNGYYRVVGEVENIGDKSVQVRVNATFYSADNAVIASNPPYSYVMLNVILPGRKAPFEIVLGNKTASTLVHHYSLSASGQEYPSEKHSFLQIMQSTTYIDREGFQRVNGTVKNLATSNATGVRVAATFYNDKGDVVGVAYDYTTPSTIMPNHTNSFELELIYKAGNFSSYILTAESIEYSVVSPVSTLAVSLTLDATVVNSRANVSLQVHVVNGTLPVESASVQLVSDKGGVFNPQSGYTSSNGNFTATFTAPIVTTQTLITITANATKTGYILGQTQKQITVNPISSPPKENGKQPDLILWMYFAALVIVIAAIGGGVAIVRRRRHTQRTKK